MAKAAFYNERPGGIYVYITLQQRDVVDDASQIFPFARLSGCRIRSPEPRPR